MHAHISINLYTHELAHTRTHALDGHLDLGAFGCRVIVANRLIISENVCNALVFITYASFSTVTRVSDIVGYTVN